MTCDPETEYRARAFAECVRLRKIYLEAESAVSNENVGRDGTPEWEAFCCALEMYDTAIALSFIAHGIVEAEVIEACK